MEKGIEIYPNKHLMSPLDLESATKQNIKWKSVQMRRPG